MRILRNAIPISHFFSFLSAYSSYSSTSLPSSLTFPSSLTSLTQGNSSERTSPAFQRQTVASQFPHSPKGPSRLHLNPSCSPHSFAKIDLIATDTISRHSQASHLFQRRSFEVLDVLVAQTRHFRYLCHLSDSHFRCTFAPKLHYTILGLGESFILVHVYTWMRSNLGSEHVSQWFDSSPRV